MDRYESEAKREGQVNTWTGPCLTPDELSAEGVSEIIVGCATAIVAVREDRVLFSQYNAKTGACAYSIGASIPVADSSDIAKSLAVDRELVATIGGDCLAHDDDACTLGVETSVRPSRAMGLFRASFVDPDGELAAEIAGLPMAREKGVLGSSVLGCEFAVELTQRAVGQTEVTVRRVSAVSGQFPHILPVAEWKARDSGRLLRLINR